MTKTTRETQYGVIWGNDPEPVIQYGMRSLIEVDEAAAITQARLEKSTGVELDYKIVRREITYSETEWQDA